MSREFRIFPLWQLTQEPSFFMGFLKADFFTSCGTAEPSRPGRVL
jgi:hypothetical protein